MDELKMTNYDKDSSAVAVVLADYGQSQIVYIQGKGFELHFERLRRLKILKKEGYDLANFSIPLYQENNKDEKVNSIKAVTINLEEGKAIETKLGKDGIFEEQVNENWNNVRLAMPNVREGSVIDISYKITSPYLFNFQDWDFQSTIPVKWSEYVAQIPEYFEYQRFMQGYVALKVNELTTPKKFITLNSKERTGNFVQNTTFSTEKIEYTENNFRWVATDVPAFKVEPYMTTYKDYISRMNFELAYIHMPNRPVETIMGTWANINKEFLDAAQFGGVIKRSNFLNKTVEELTANKSNDSEKISVIYNFVKEKVEWDGNYRKYTDGNFKRVIDEKRGNSAEINLMLVSMLQKAGVQADPVVISTRNNGFVREQFPLSSQFNYVICAVQANDNLMLLDATDRSLSMNLIPERCLNGRGLLISETQSRWIDLESAVKTRTVIDATIAFDEDGILKGQLKLTKDGYDGQQMRKDFHSKGEETYVKSIAEQGGWTIHSSNFENLKNLNEPVTEAYELSFADEAQQMADILYISPMLESGLKENPFKSEKREYPVDFGKPFEQTQLIRLKIPEGYVVEELPEPVAMALPNRGGRYIYNLSTMNGVISLTSQLVISKGLFTQLEYPYLREFYDKMMAKQEQQIVLKKSAK